MSNNIDKIIDKVDKLTKSRRFNRETKIQEFDDSKQLAYEDWPDSWKKIDYKGYPRLKQILLPDPENIENKLQSVLVSRVSSRNFSRTPIEKRELSNLLYYTAGVKGVIKDNENEGRFYPSAGARYPLEVYPFVFRVEDLDQAVYHYHLKSHSLELLLEKPIFRRTMRQFEQSWIRNSGVLLVISAVFDRTEGKYGNRGYRHILTEYGHMAQNIYLVSDALNLGACSIGGFIDDGLNEILDINGIDESVIGVVAVGKVNSKK